MAQPRRDRTRGPDGRGERRRERPTRAVDRDGRGRPKKHFRFAPERPKPGDRPRGPPDVDDRFRPEHRAAPVGGRPQVEGRRAVLEALRAGVEVRHLMLSDKAEPSPTLDAIYTEARTRRLTVEKVPPEALDAQSETGRHQGVIAEVVLPASLSLDQVLARAAAAGGDPFFVVLDGVEDPQNLGAIARSAEAAGATAIIVPARHSASVSPGSLRASAGAILLLPVVVVANTAKCLEALKARGIWVVGAHADGEKLYHQASLSGPLALVIGGEHKGLKRLVRERCDFLVRVPLHGRVESLNASAAAAVLLFEVARQRALAAAPPTEHTKTLK